MKLDLLVLANHNIDTSKVLELKNRVEKKISGFTLTNTEHLKEIQLLKHAYDYGNIDENEIITAKILKMSMDSNNKVNVEKEFTREQVRKQLEIAAKLDTKDRLLNCDIFDAKYRVVGNNAIDNSVHVSGFMNLSFDVDFHLIEIFHDVQYKDWIHLHKIIRDEWRKYFYQIIRLLGGNKAIYIPSYIYDFINEYADLESNCKDIYLIEEFLIEIFGENKKEIDGISKNEYSGYIMDDFSDINLDKNINIDDFKKYLRHLY